MATAAKGVYFEDLSVGQEASLSNAVSEATIAAFAEVSGDRNPVHMDAQYAAATMFKGRIAHGMLSAAYISAVFGMKLPGPGAIYISQTLFFKAPVKIGDTVVTTVKVAELIPEKKRAKFCVRVHRQWQARGRGRSRAHGARGARRKRSAPQLAYRGLRAPRAGEVDARKRTMAVTAAHDGVGQHGADHRHDDADHDLGDPILHGRGGC